jgi:signal transduction histidine kinase
VTVERAGERVRLRVVDKGRGFDPEAPQTADPGHGFGLISMRGRARAVGADFVLSSQAGRGTTVEVAV